MSGTKEGAAKARAKILARDPDYYKKIGAIGGRNGNTGGFASNRDLAIRAGQKGGRISNRSKVKPDLETRRRNYLNSTKRYKDKIFYYCEMAIDRSENLDITL